MKRPLIVGCLLSSYGKATFGMFNLHVGVYKDYTMFTDGSSFLMQQEKRSQAKQKAAVQRHLQQEEDVRTCQTNGQMSQQHMC